MEYSPQNLEYAVSVFYNGEQSERAKAHAWLTAAQRVPEAWNFVWEFLQPSKGTEIQFYAATTLHTKILRCWNEVPPESYEELKNKLLEAVFTYSKGPKIVTNRLCISLAAFILQQGTVDLAAILSPLSTPENTALLLEVLTVIPEEYNSMTMGSSLRTKNRIALQQACPAVLDDMLRCLQTVYNPEYTKEAPSEETVQNWVTVATCACSWLTLGGEDAAEHPRGSLPDRMPLCRALLAVVQLLSTWNSVVSDSALDACEACLSGVRAAASTSASARYPESALQLLAHLAALTAPLMARDNVPNSVNEELLSALLTCCVAVGECHAHTLVTAAESAEDTETTRGARQVIELVLAAQAAPGHYPIHETRSNLTFGFWYTLQDELLNLMDRTNDIHQVWKQVFSRLLETLITKSIAAPDADLCKDDLELLRCYRQDTADSVMYCYGVLGEWCWSIVERSYSGAGSEAAREAALHVFAALADAAPAQRAPPALLQLLHHALHAAHSATAKPMLSTALDCLGGYATWVGSVASVSADAALASLGRECVRAAGAALARCPPAAALALRKLAADCSGPAAALAPDIVQAAQSFQGSGSKSDAWVRRQLVAAAGASLAAAELRDAAPLLQPLARALHADLVAQAQSPLGGASAAECSAALMGSLAAAGPLAADLFRVLAPALPPYASNAALVESLFHILKQTVSSLISELMPVVADVAELLLAGFNTCPCASGLDVVKLMVMSVGEEWPGCRNVLRASVAPTARLLTQEPGVRPDVTEGLFSLLQTLTKKRPQYIDWIDDMLLNLIELALCSVRVWEAGGARAACGWLSALAAARAHALQPYAPALTATALLCIGCVSVPGGMTPRNQIEPLADLLLSLNRATWKEAGQGTEAGQGAGLATWLRNALAVPDFPTHHATDPHKHKFIQSVIKEKSSKRRILESVQEFSLVCRGLVDTEYARQTIASKQLVA
ncbi:importin-13 isoform X1 [Spodoptera frugiperda]|uniref:Importin-13 isoform X1 n=1 Tax=Spodoptera frugiperda TaxID=7108 RepID=A0A9R0E1Q5_SPOFR|nr:importin-13 isoform X1 [Spodoptera frugiperda]